MERLAKDGDPQALRRHSTELVSRMCDVTCEAHSLPRPLSKTRDKAEANSSRKVAEMDGGKTLQSLDACMHLHLSAFASIALYTLLHGSRWLKSGRTSKDTKLIL